MSGLTFVTTNRLRDVLTTLGADASNNVSIETDGTLVFNGEATVWEDLMVPGLSVGTGASAPDLGTFGPSGNIKTFLFDGNSTSEQVYFTIQLQHSYKQGSNIKPHVHWAPTTTNAGNVKWFFEYTWSNIGGTFGAPTTISVVDAAAGTAWQHQLSSLPDITGTSKTISSMLMCRLYRNPADGSDTYPDDVAFLQFDVHYEMDTVGSREASSK